MARPKNPELKDKIEEIKEKLEQERQIRVEKIKKPKDNITEREAFKNYWAVSKKSFNRGKDIEDILWSHLKAIKHDKPELFEAGLLNFGLKKIN